MNNLEFTKEVTYLFKYENEEYREHIYTDNVEGRRYRTSRVSPLPADLYPQNIKGLNTEEQLIEPELVGATESGNDMILLYFLPDIEQYVHILKWSDGLGWAIEYLDKI